MAAASRTQHPLFKAEAGGAKATRGTHSSSWEECQEQTRLSPAFLEHSSTCSDIMDVPVSKKGETVSYFLKLTTLSQFKG